MGCGDGEAPGEHQHNQEEEQLRLFYWQRKKKNPQNVNLRESLYLADWKVNVVEHIARSVEEAPVSRTTTWALEPGKGFYSDLLG